MEENKKPRVRDLFAWQSPSWPALDYPKGTFALLGSIVVFITVIFILFQEWLAIAVSWTAYLVFFLIHRIPPTIVSHKITTEGIVSMGTSYLWEELGPFWFKTSRGETVLHIASRRNWFTHLIMIIKPEDKEKIIDILAEYLPFIETPQKTLSEKIAEWWEKKFSPRSAV